MSKNISIIGAGLAGLSCALKLQSEGYSATIIEKADAVGGRVRTDHHEGYILDHGFQVLLTAYPECQKVLDYSTLELKKFKSGARIWRDEKFHDVVDPLRHTEAWVGSAFSPIGTFTDKIKVLAMSRSLKRKSIGEIFTAAESSTAEALRKRYGFSENIISSFYGPFLSGIMLDPSLTSSSRMFEFVMKMFAEGQAAVPANGMQDISEQLLSQLPLGSVRLNTKVSEISSSELILENMETVSFDRLVIAADNPSASKLSAKVGERKSKSVTCLYFGLPKRENKDAILYLNGSGGGKINNLVFMSHISPKYAPEGKDLAAISVISSGEDINDLVNEVKEELKSWFGQEIQAWVHLKTFDIPHSQPDQSPPAFNPPHRDPRVGENIFLAGDYMTNASINGAMVSGRLTAEAVINSL